MGISNRKGTVPLLDLLHKQPRPRDGDGHGVGQVGGPAAAQGNGSATGGAASSNPLGKPVVRIELKPRDASRTTMTPIRVQPLMAPAKPVEVAAAHPASAPVHPGVIGGGSSASSHASRHALQPHVIPAAAAAHVAVQSPSPLPTLVPVPHAEHAAQVMSSPTTRAATELAPAGVGISPALISRIAIGLLGLGLVALLVYVVGYRLGGSDKKKELEPMLRTGVPAVVEPKPAPPSTTPAAPSDQPARPTTGKPNTSTQEPTTSTTRAKTVGGLVTPSIVPGMFEDPQPPAGGILTSAGWLTVDPRESGKNYLILSKRMVRNEAGTAVLFLASNGVQAFAVPLDKTGAQAKNPSRDFYVLYAGPGVSRESLPASDGSRPSDLQRSVARLGTAYRKELKGETDFDGAYYELYRREK
jgi:hypothetical protein